MHEDAALATVLERLTGQARRALALAFQEARANQDDHVGTEHVLLGLLHESDTGAAALLRMLNVEPARLHGQIRVLLHRPAHGLLVDRPPLTPGVRRALAWAAEEAAEARQAHIAPEHILVGLSQEQDSLAHFLLEESGMDSVALRSALPRLPQHENRDQLVQAPRGMGTPPHVDPTLIELQDLIFAHRRPAEPDVAMPGARPRVFGLAGEFDNLRRHTANAQAMLAIVVGTAVGAGLGTWKMVLCMIAGIVVGTLRSSWLGALAGAIAGLGLARALCPGQMTESLLLIFITMFAGIFVGDWPLRLLEGYRTETPTDTPEP